MTAPIEQIVGMGEVKTGTGGEVLIATLGSCVGIAFLWSKAGRCGLAHCLLPEAREFGTQRSAAYKIGARYVDQAVPSLLAIERTGLPRRRSRHHWGSTHVQRPA